MEFRFRQGVTEPSHCAGPPPPRCRRRYHQRGEHSGRRAERRGARRHVWMTDEGARRKLGRSIEVQVRALNNFQLWLR
eukprot:scaffold230705_cov39-Tisochrysis_lutea.AAC.1